MSINVGLDVGYADVKCVYADGRFKFPSLVGTPEQSTYRAQGGESQHITITVDGEVHNVGQGAIEQSRYAPRNEGRNWITSKEYKLLIMAAFSMLPNVRGAVELTLVTGLPAAFFEEDKAKLAEVFEGKHIVTRKGQEATVFDVVKFRAMPQYFGTIQDQVRNSNGDIVASEYTDPGFRFGVIDIGGNTTNIAHVLGGSDVRAETSSFDVGGWNVVRAIREPLQNLCPDVDYKDHEVANMIISGNVRYKGRMVELGKIVDDALVPMANDIVKKARQLWEGGEAKVHEILITGGGALLLGDKVKALLDHENVRIVDDAVFANARGYYKSAVRASK